MIILIRYRSWSVWSCCTLAHCGHISYTQAPPEQTDCLKHDQFLYPPLHICQPHITIFPMFCLTPEINLETDRLSRSWHGSRISKSNTHVSLNFKYLQIEENPLKQKCWPCQRDNALFFVFIRNCPSETFFQMF